MITGIACTVTLAAIALHQLLVAQRHRKAALAASARCAAQRRMLLAVHAALGRAHDAAVQGDREGVSRALRAATEAASGELSAADDVTRCPIAQSDTRRSRRDGTAE